MSTSEGSSSELLQAFRRYYNGFVQSIHDAIHSSADSTVLERLGDDLDRYLELVLEVRKHSSSLPSSSIERLDCF